MRPHSSVGGIIPNNVKLKFLCNVRYVRATPYVKGPNNALRYPNITDGYGLKGPPIPGQQRPRLGRPKIGDRLGSRGDIGLMSRLSPRLHQGRRIPLPHGWERQQSIPIRVRSARERKPIGLQAKGDGRVKRIHGRKSLAR